MQRDDEKAEVVSDEHSEREKAEKWWLLESKDLQPTNLPSGAWDTFPNENVTLC